MKGICNNNESDPKSGDGGVGMLGGGGGGGRDMLQVENREEGRCGRRSLI